MNLDQLKGLIPLLENSSVELMLCVSADNIVEVQKLLKDNGYFCYLEKTVFNACHLSIIGKKS